MSQSEKNVDDEEQLKDLLNESNQVDGKLKITVPESPNKLPPPPVKTGWKKYAGIIFTLISSIFFTLIIIIVKILKNYHPFSISIWMFLGIVVPAIPIVLYFIHVKKENVFDTVYPFDSKEKIWNLVILMIRGFLICSMVLTRFYAIQYLTVADVTVISHSGPVFVTILAHIFLDEKCGVVSILVSILTGFGVVVIVRPPFITGSESFDTGMLVGVGLSVLSTACNSVMTILARKQRKIHFSLMLLTSGTWGVLGSLIFAQAFGVLEIPKGSYDLVLALAALPVVSFLAHLLIILALKFEKASTVSLMRTGDVIFAFIWQMIFLNVFPDDYSLVGAVIVIIGVMVITLRSMLNSLPPEDPRKRRFRLLLY